jgi:hypothetical protein
MSAAASDRHHYTIREMQFRLVVGGMHKNKQVIIHGAKIRNRPRLRCCGAHLKSCSSSQSRQPRRHSRKATCENTLRSLDLSITLPEIAVSRIVPKAISPSLGLNDVSALAAKSFVVPQGIDDLARFTPFEENSQCHTVFDGLISALSKVREHGMGGVTEQRKTSFGP